MILQELNNSSPAKTFEKIALAGIKYFEREELLWRCSGTIRNIGN